MDYDKLGQILVEFYTRTLQHLQPQLSHDQMQIHAAKAAVIAVQYAKAHPYHTAFTAISVGFTPLLGAGWMTGPILKLIGFGPLGPVGGSMAAWYQATWLGGYIPAGSIFAALQQWAMTLA